MKDVVINKINATDFMSNALMTDETFYCQKMSQITAMFRYVGESNMLPEIFLVSSDVSSNRSIKALSEHVIDVVERLGCRQKIICKIYNGASSISRTLSDTKYESELIFHL